MTYTVNKLSKLAGISTRTLRYYHEIGLLIPKKMSESGYRLYGEAEVDRLQQILFYKALGMELETIKEILNDSQYDREEALISHLEALHQKRTQIDLLIKNVSKTIEALKGETTMTNQEKFEGFKTQMIEENEKQYGEEIRKQYGNQTINKANQKVKGMTQMQYEEATRLEAEIKEKLKVAFKLGDPKSESAREVCKLHKEWLGYYWPEGVYSIEAHKNLAQTYVDDSRFAAYYNAVVAGGAQFLRDAIWYYYESLPE